MTIHLTDAAKCPKCGIVGEVTGNEKLRRDGVVWDITAYKCVTKLCMWFGTGWAVESDPNGIVFERNRGERGMDKTFTPLSKDQLAYGRMLVEDAIRSEIKE